MGERGPAKQPTALKLVRGETRPSRVNKSEPKPPVDAALVPPAFLDADAKAVWKRLAPSLHSRGVLTAWDIDLFGAFCTAVVHHRRAVVAVNKSGVLIKNRTSSVKHPAMQIIRDQAAIMTTIGGRFGLTPSDRSSLTIPEGSEGDGAAVAAAVLD